MLSWMRRLSKSWISSVLLGGLALSFAVWGIADVFRGNVSDTVASVGSTQISAQEFKTAYDRQLNIYRAETGQALTPEQARALDAPNQVLQAMITRAALDNLASELGLTVGDSEVSAAIQSDRNFAGPLGTFDKATFQQLIAQMGVSEQRYIENVRGDMTREQLVGPFEAGFQIPDAYLQALFAAGNEARAVQYVVLAPDQAGEIAPPSDAVLAAYEKAHAQRFSTPEYRAVSYAFIGPDDVMSEVQVTDAQIKQAYELAQSTYNVPEKRDLEQINFPNQADAQAARAKIDAGQSFAQIAAARGLKPSDISIGSRVAADLDPAAAKAVFALPVNGVSAPLKGAFGTMLIHVTAITPGKVTTLAEATPDLKKAIANELAQAKLADISNAYSDALGAGADVAEAAKKAGMRFGQVAAMDANGLDQGGKPSTAPDNAEFRAQVFKSDIGEAGDAFLTKDGHYYAVKVEGTTPPKLKPLDAVRADVLAAWTAEQRAAALKKKADALVAQAQKDQSLTAVAQSLGAPVQTSPALTRRSVNEVFSAQFITALFEAAPGAAFAAPVGKGDGIVVARVTGIAHPVIPVQDPTFQQIKPTVSRQIAGDVTVSLANDLRAKQGATVNHQLLDSTTGQGS